MNSKIVHGGDNIVASDRRGSFGLESFSFKSRPRMRADFSKKQQKPAETAMVLSGSLDKLARNSRMRPAKPRPKNKPRSASPGKRQLILYPEGC
jgi:hypothetical protein